MPVIGSMDTTNRRIQLAAGVRSYHPVDDIYQEVRALRRTDETLRAFAVPVTAAGHVPKGGGKFTPRYIVLHGGWRIVPEDVSHTLDVTGEQLTEEGGSGGDCLDLSTLSATSKVVVQYAPSEAEVIEVSTGGGADWSAGERAQILSALDATVSSRAESGAAMALTSAERTSVAGVVNATLEAGRLDAAVSSRATAGDPMALTAAERTATAGVVNSTLEAGRLDAAVSSRAAPGDAMALTSAERDATADAVWDEPSAGHVVAGSVGERQARLDTAVSSRSTAGDAMALTAAERSSVASVVNTTLEANNLDAAVSSRAIPGDAMALTSAERSTIAAAIQASGALSDSQAEQLITLYELAGLDPTKPLVVTETSRRVPADGTSIDQTITKTSGTATVQRQ